MLCGACAGVPVDLCVVFLSAALFLFLRVVRTPYLRLQRVFILLVSQGPKKNSLSGEAVAVRVSVCSLNFLPLRRPLLLPSSFPSTLL